MRKLILLFFEIAAGICSAATTYDLANGNVTVPANTTATITQSNSGTATSNWISIGSGATVTLTGININGDYIDMSRYQYVSVGAGATVILNGVKIVVTDSQVNAITCNGAATFVLADGSSNTITAGPNEKCTMKSSGTLKFMGGSSGTGKLSVTFNNSQSDYGAIFSSGEIIIEGGSITATSNGYGAPIGGTRKSRCGNITIKGGSVNAKCTGYNAGIGGYCNNITISGGTVVARGASMAAGIGDAYYSDGSCGNITISGGNVTAYGGSSAAGIGTGLVGECGNIKITGGTVTAIGGSGSAGIGTSKSTGAGSYGTCGDITIANTITKVIATKGDANASNYIGKTDSYSHVGTITLGNKLRKTYSNNNLTMTLQPVFTITWKNENGTTLETDTDVLGGTVPTYNGATPTKASTAQYTYTFKGWSPTVVAATADKTYTATYTANLRSYTVTWKNDDGSTLKTESVSYGTIPDYGGEPEKQATDGKAYAFAGWMPEVVSVTGAATYTATYVKLNPEEPVISPESGTTFDGSLSVSMSCATEGATIHYTTNGVDPTAESPEYRRFRVYGKTTVKAIAEKDGLLSDVVTAYYAPGRCVDPVFSLADGAEFAHSNQVVSIRWENDGVLRYTLDGTDPTADSPIYEGPFSFSDSVELRAKVFSDDFFESSVVTASLTRVWENVATPVIDAAASFTGSKTKVVISCATKDATIRYTLNGNDPNSHSTKYTGPFYVTNSCTVKAYAVMTDYLNSAVATQEIVKEWGIGDSLGKPDHGFTTDGSAGAGWVRVVDATAPNGEAMKSGAITHDQSSVLATTVVGPGTLTFSWRTSCEDSGGAYDWDHVEFAVDGDVLLKRDGINNWAAESVVIAGEGEHTVTWTYMKDDVEGDGDDAAYVAGYGWASDLAETQTTEVHVPYSWLLTHDPEIVDEYDAYESAAKLTGENGHNVWESYAIGANPNDKNDSLKITAFPMKADGTPNLDAIEISPTQSKWNVQGATPMLKGKATLEGEGEWQPVTDENKADMRFFKVEVVLP